MGSVKPDPPFVSQHERAKAWKMRALELTVRRQKARRRENDEKRLHD